MNIDDLLGRLHNEASSRIEDQLSAIERELMRRRLLSAETTTTLFAQLQDLNEQIMSSLPEGEHSVDLHRIERQGLQREQRAIERELQLELRERWRDLQSLRREHRELLDQQRKGEDRYRLHTEY